MQKHRIGKRDDNPFTGANLYLIYDRNIVWSRNTVCQMSWGKLGVAVGDVTAGEVAAGIDRCTVRVWCHLIMWQAMGPSH